MKKMFLLLFIIFLTNTCQLDQKIMPKDSPYLIVFIHGIKGSVLENSEGKKVWLTGLSAINLSTPNLALPMVFNDGVQDRDSFVPTEPLRNVYVIPKVLGEKVYEPFLEAMEQKWGEDFSSFAYDWRRDNNENADRFERHLSVIKDDHKGKKLIVIAHSMGGLITLVVANRNQKLIDKIVYAGVPFRGGIGFLDDLHKGISSGFNAKILSPKVLFTFPSVFTLFPLSSKGRGLLLDKSGKEIPNDFFSPKDWESLKLSIFSEPNLQNAQEVRDYLFKALEVSKVFRESLVPKDGQHPKTLVVTSKSRDTIRSIQKDGPKSFQGWDIDSTKRELGDGRVCYDDSLPPKPIQFDTFFSNQVHSALLNDPVVIAKIQEFIQKN